MLIIHDKLERFYVCNIFNMNQTGLLYRAMPTR
jgi:hypothetical protein